MTRIRPQSLSGLLSAALLLIVLPLTAALVYSGVQLRQLSRTSDVLVRDSITLTQHTQLMFQDITAMERAANYYGVLNDPRVAKAFESHYVAFLRTLEKLAEYVPETDIEPVRSAGEATAGLMRADSTGGRTGSVVGRFETLNDAANRLAQGARLGIDSRLKQVEREAKMT